jgi:hypothetical protein
VGCNASKRRKEEQHNFIYCERELIGAGVGQNTKG